MKRREAAGKSEARTAHFLKEILSPLILETEMFLVLWHLGILKYWLIHQGKLDVPFFHSLTHTKRPKV